mgnify:CR=1 FL=1
MRERPRLVVMLTTPVRASVPIQHAVRAAQHLDAFNPGRGQVREIEGAADVVGRHAVDQHLREV